MDTVHEQEDTHEQHEEHERSFESFSSWDQLVSSLKANPHFQRCADFVNGLQQRVSV